MLLACQVRRQAMEATDLGLRLELGCDFCKEVQAALSSRLALSGR